MKIQGIAIIFAIIILPIIIVVSYYMQNSIDTIALQNSYDTKLINATHDAMTSFEINTANENLSSVADSLRSIIEASTNVFFNTLATNLGMSNASKSYLQNYIPAMLYTLYDGYYIYAPTRVPTILTAGDEQVIYVGDRGVTIAGDGKYRFNKQEYEKELDPTTKENEATKSARQAALYDALPNNRKNEYGQMLYENKDGTYSTQINDDTIYNQDHVLKSYMPYSARYKEEGNYDLTINYTLDNYLTVSGKIGERYYSKTGYLIAKDVVKSISVDGATDLLTYNENDAEDICLSGQHTLILKIQPMLEDGVTRASEIEIKYEPYQENGVYLNSIQLEEKLNTLNTELENNEGIITSIQDLEMRLSDLKAITYYVKAQIFSNWIYENLGSEGLKIKGKNLAEDIISLNEGIYTTTKETDIFHDFSTDDNIIFNSTIDPEKEDSPFYSHKLDVIQNAIQYNLNLAISSYDVMTEQLDIQMPVITDDEWDKILKNVSIVSFMQGLNCGMKIYNNYAIVSSTNNELTIIPNEVYYTHKVGYNTASITNEYNIYHRIDCPELKEKTTEGPDEFGYEEPDNEYISFTSKEIKYDKIYDKKSQKYKYDHRNRACYNCIINSNYLKTINSEGDKGYSDKILISTLSKDKQKTYYTAIAKERQNLYKTNALITSDGYEVLFTSNTSNQLTFANTENATLVIPLDKNSSIGINKIKEIEVTIRDITSGNQNEATAVFHGIVNGVEINENLVLNLQQATPQTITIPVHIENSLPLNNLQLMKINPEDAVTCNILSVRVIYE